MVDLSPVHAGSYNEVYQSLRRYPACILLYSAGVACVASANYDTLKILMRDQRTTIDSPLEGKDSLLIHKLVAPYVLNEESLNRCSNPERKKFPSSVRLHALLRETARAFLPNDLEYDGAFDRFEYLLSLLFYEANSGRYAPIGRFGLKYSSLFPSSSMPAGQALLNEHAAQGQGWGPLKSGLFESSEDFLAIEKGFRETILIRASQY
jgi:hypothetical protein